MSLTSKRPGRLTKATQADWYIPSPLKADHIGIWQTRHWEPATWTRFLLLAVSAT